MILLFTIITFALFVLYVEVTALIIKFKAMIFQIDRTMGRAYWIYPTTRNQQEWMRTNTIQLYK